MQVPSLSLISPSTTVVRVFIAPSSTSSSSVRSHKSLLALLSTPPPTWLWCRKTTSALADPAWELNSYNSPVLHVFDAYGSVLLLACVHLRIHTLPAWIGACMYVGIRDLRAYIVVFHAALGLHTRVRHHWSFLNPLSCRRTRDVGCYNSSFLHFYFHFCSRSSFGGSMKSCPRQPSLTSLDCLYEFARLNGLDSDRNVLRYMTTQSARLECFAARLAYHATSLDRKLSFVFWLVLFLVHFRSLSSTRSFTSTNAWRYAKTSRMYGSLCPS